MIYVVFRPTVLVKGKRAPIGATSEDGKRRKVAEGKWVPVRQQERPNITTDADSFVANLSGENLAAVLHDIQNRLVMEYQDPEEQSRLAEAYVFLYGKRLMEQGAGKENANVLSYLRHKDDPEFFKRVRLGEFAQGKAA